MSILDAGVLGHCLGKWGSENLGSVLEEFQSIRLPIVSKHVLHARKSGRIKQGLVVQDQKAFDAMTPLKESLQLQQRNMPFFRIVEKGACWISINGGREEDITKGDCGGWKHRGLIMCPCFGQRQIGGDCD